MTLEQILPAVAGAGIGVYTFCLLAGIRLPPRQAWLLPASLSFAFLMFSLYAVLTISPTGFWVEHTRNAWGVQIWFDLLLAVGIALAFVIPKARKVGMNVWLWAILTLSTGCIGLCAMTARLLYLQSRQAGA